MVTSSISFRQTDMKSLIAYRSIGHISLVLGGLVSQTDCGVNGAIFIAVAHGLSSPAIFNLARIIYEKTLSRSLLVSKGIVRILPVSYGLFFLVCAANISAPPLISLLREVLLVTSILAFC